MPICPNCRLEYKEDITVCPGCGSALIPIVFDETPDIETRENGDNTLNDDYIEIARFRSRKQVELILSEFRLKGIPAIVRSAPDIKSQQDSRPDIKNHTYAFSLLISLDYAAEADAEGENILGEEWEKSKLIGLSD